MKNINKSKMCSANSINNKLSKKQVQDYILLFMLTAIL